MIQKINDNNYNVYTKPKTHNIPETGEKFNLNYAHGETSPEAKDKDKVSDSKKQYTTEQSGVRLELSIEGQDAGAQRQRQEDSSETQNTPAQGSLVKTIRTHIISAIKAVQKFFHDIWYSQPPEETPEEPLLISGEEILPDITQDTVPEDSLDIMQDNVLEDTLDITQGTTRGNLLNSLADTSQKTSRSTADIADEREALAAYEARRERMILQLLSEGNREQAINVLTENGKRTVAKNSTLLTSYDKNGKVVEASSSDRERTLHGDRNTWQL